MKCADCQIPVHVPKDAHPEREHRVCVDCYQNRLATVVGKTHSPTGEVRLEHEGKVVRWSTPERSH